MRIYLIGFMGSGKSTVGHHLAHQLEWDFADTDKIISSLSSQSISEIFACQGEQWFREREREILLSLRESNNTVIATGGGLPCFKDNMEIMNRTGITVYLRLPPEILTDRLLHGYRERPLLQNKTPEEISQYVAETLRKREAYYEKAALIIDAAYKSAEDVARLIREGINLVEKY